MATIPDSPSGLSHLHWCSLCGELGDWAPRHVLGRQDPEFFCPDCNEGYADPLIYALLLSSTARSLRGAPRLADAYRLADRACVCLLYDKLASKQAIEHTEGDVTAVQRLLDRRVVYFLRMASRYLARRGVSRRPWDVIGTEFVKPRIHTESLCFTLRTQTEYVRTWLEEDRLGGRKLRWVRRGLRVITLGGSRSHMRVSDDGRRVIIYGSWFRASSNDEDLLADSSAPSVALLLLHIQPLRTDELSLTISWREITYPEGPGVPLVDSCRPLVLDLVRDMAQFWSEIRDGTDYVKIDPDGARLHAATADRGGHPVNNAARDAEIYDRAEQGQSQGQLAIAYHLSDSRIKQILREQRNKRG